MGFLVAPWLPAQLTTEEAPPRTLPEEVSSIYLYNVKTLLQKQLLQPPEGLQLMLEEGSFRMTPDPFCSGNC